ncbi:MAG: methyltransferase domain-containing protein [Nitriliruptorales bacterium]|nr:methyltransferase domain-containing protein [Nitriliruptorales bacterium]
MTLDDALPSTLRPAGQPTGWPRASLLPCAGDPPITVTPPSDAHRPTLDDLAKALDEVQPYLEAARTALGRGYVNYEGGDVGGHSTERSLFRHVANYLAAADLAQTAGLHDSVLDVGSGTGALTAWVAGRLGAELHLVDRDPGVRRVALSAFPHAHVHATLDEVPRATVGLVTAMEVIEHISPDEQHTFVTALVSRVEPGGLLVVSTPDESGYTGGSSGYAPHIGCLDAPGLQTVLQNAAPTAQVTVWRLEGDPFHLGRVRRLVQPVANRLWTAVGPLLGPVAHRIAGPAASFADLARTHAGPELAPEVRALPASEGSGTGLVGVVHVGAGQ